MANLRITTNMNRVKKSISDTRASYLVRTRDLSRKQGRATKKNIKRNIAPRSNGGVFPGYAMTGALRKTVVASASRKAGNGWQVRVRMSLAGKTKAYALIHETGGIIRVKNAPYLVFQVKGQWFKKKSVRIRKKAYFEKGIKKTRAEFDEKRLKKEF